MEIEALTAVKMAWEFKNKNANKARKLFRHALTLGPNNHRVLLNYGLFLESFGDVIGADHFYFKAIASRPGDSEASSHRLRTLPLADAFDSQELKRIDSKKPTTLNWFQDGDAYFRHVYHTVAIEGNTLSLNEMRKIIETKSALPNKSISECEQVLGLDSALRYLKEVDSGVFDLADLFEIHARVMGFSSKAFRETQVFVGEHVPPAASDVGPLMDEFFETIRSTAKHPIRTAAFVHRELASIHPFVDGNGRTSRLAMNLVLTRHGYPPIIIEKRDRRKYFDLLQETDVRPFYRFVSGIVERTIDDALRNVNRNK